MNHGFYEAGLPLEIIFLKTHPPTETQIPSLPETSIARENRSSQNDMSSSKHQFSGAMLVSFSERRTWTLFFRVPTRDNPRVELWGIWVDYHLGISWCIPRVSRHPFTNKNVILVVTIAFWEVHTPQVTSETGIQVYCCWKTSSTNTEDTVDGSEIRLTS